MINTQTSERSTHAHNTTNEFNTRKSVHSRDNLRIRDCTIKTILTAIWPHLSTQRSVPVLPLQGGALELPRRAHMLLAPLTRDKVRVNRWQPAHTHHAHNYKHKLQTHEILQIHHNFRISNCTINNILTAIWPHHSTKRSIPVLSLQGGALEVARRA